VFQSWGFLTSPRATSIFAGWHPFAGYLTIVLLLTVGVFASSAHRKRVVRPRWLGVIGLLALVALLYSETFTAMLGVVGGAFIIAWFHRSTKLLGWLLAGAAVLALAAAFFLGHRLESQLEADEDSVVPQTISYRIDVWGEQYVPVLRDYWATGYGPALPDTIEWQSTESQYLTLVLRGGLPLLLVYGALMAAMGVRANRLRSHADPTIRAVAPVVLTAVIVLVPMNALFPYFTASGLAQIFWVLVGVLVSVRRDARPDGDDVDGGPWVGAASPGASRTGRRKLLPA
jgi:hypothetical protein